MTHASDTESRAQMRTAGWTATCVAIVLCVAMQPSAAHAQPRLRLGAGAVGGGFVGAVHGAGGGFAVRAGVQIDDLVAVYVQGHGMLGSFVPSPERPVAVGFVFHELMVDLTFLDLFQIGAGPSIDVLWGCAAENGGTNCDRPGPYFGGDLRLALVVDGPSHRAGMAITLDAHPTWLGSDLVATFLFGLGGEVW